MATDDINEVRYVFVFSFGNFTKIRNIFKQLLISLVYVPRIELTNTLRMFPRVKWMIGKSFINRVMSTFNKLNWFWMYIISLDEQPFDRDRFEGVNNPEIARAKSVWNHHRQIWYVM